MKKLLFPILTLGIVTAGSCLFKTEPASAYCVYNESDTPITALQLPIDSDSFKQVVDPGSKKCCNWRDDSCTAEDGRYGKTPFVVYEGTLDTDAITASEILDDINNTAFKIVEAVVSTFGVPPVSSILLDEISQQLGSLASGKQSLGTVPTYNGGIVWYDGSGKPVGCWVGPCQGQDINYDGTTGTKQDD